MVYFNVKYLVPAVLLFMVEIIIAMYAHDAILRPFVGDFLVVILIYCFVKTFINVSLKRTSTWFLVFAYSVELSQRFHLINSFGLENSKIARLIMGDYFSWTDMLMYTMGIILVVIIESIAANLLAAEHAKG